MEEDDFIDEENRIIYIKDIEEEMADIIVKKIMEWEAIAVNDEENSITPVTFIINSMGGSLDAGLQIIDAIELTSLPTIAINTSKAYSAAAFIFMACDEKYTFPNASFLLHEGSVEIDDEKTADQWRQWFSFYEKQLKRVRDFILQHTNYHEDNQVKIIMEKDNYITASDAFNLGICEKILKKGELNLWY